MAIWVDDFTCDMATAATPHYVVDAEDRRKCRGLVQLVNLAALSRTDCDEKHWKAAQEKRPIQFWNLPRAVFESFFEVPKPFWDHC